MRFGILGAIEAWHDDGRPVTLGGPRTRGLLALLVMEAGQIVPGDRLIDGLYGEHPPAGATNALQSHVSRLRQALRGDTGGATVEFHPAGYRLTAAPGDVDVHRFTRLAAGGRAVLGAGDHAGAANALRDALAEWRGPALADVRDAPFAESHAARLEELRLGVLEDRIEADLSVGAHRDLVAELRDLVAAHPLRERPRGQLMRALYADGRQAEALAVFEDARRVLADELGADPSPELSRVHLAVLRADPALDRRAARIVRRGLPGQLTGFVGRTEEMERVGRLLDETRLLTLTGPGGSGKTRLAVEAGGRVEGEVCFVDLAPLAAGGDVPLAVLGALGLREEGLAHPAASGPPDPVARLLAVLADRAMLLVLDNCEHVIDAAAILTERLLAACPRLTVLATSREALGITGEALCPVPPLPLPPPGASEEEAAASPAVRLFLERAAAVRQDLPGAPGVVETAVRVCRTLDGLPLAIELAAARLRSMQPAELADRLDDRFRLLSRGSRTAQPRHQTLRAVVSWSWDLLSEAERTLARRLTVFPGGVTLDSAARVCGLPDAETVELLTALADRSLIEVAAGRYRMLETIRAFCLERLAESGEEDRFREAHAAHFLELVETAGRYLRGHEQIGWLARLTDEHDNLHGAARWAVAARRTETGLRLIAGLSPYWWLRGRRTEGAPLAAQLLATIEHDPPAEWAEEYLLCVLSALARPPEWDLGPRLATALRAAGSLTWPLRQPFVILFWGALVGVPGEGEMDGLRALLLTRIETTSDEWIRGLHHIGTAYQLLLADGAVAPAEAEFARSLASFRRCGERWGTATALTELTKLADWRGDHEAAMAMIDEALYLTEELGTLESVSEILCQRAWLRLRDGDLAGARSEFEQADVLARRTALEDSVLKAAHGLAEVARLEGDLARARELSTAALAGTGAGWFRADEIRAELSITLGRIAAAEGDLGTASGHYARGFAAAVRNPSFPIAADAVEGMAGVALLEDDPGRGALLLGIARAMRGSAMAPGADVSRDTEGIRRLLGDADHAAAVERGAAMTRAEALRLLDGLFPETPAATGV
ncbi:BTAD domain-containing putative transcriptional regulator [Spongiactinospora sp. TRM90649]|uniref:BTAD domain-containing putative transcriptional regulator n=1 Tax=Spongiactinospora sp. TRM90649 TaxID=3031114 RepID=UPI0023F6FD6B|nr:BTAD domain-containing putative transcriptional regulator [Spongiactinospora sp. TRM90649]MDF5755299.1 BTAD domain-containing putative transcriptional regulator [Spongiactinospora sp. TRM90649]